MTNQQKADAYLMRLNGASLQEIANYYGLSRQRIHQIVPHLKREEMNYYSKIVYPALRKWMAEHNCSYTQFATMINKSSSYVQGVLKGEHEPRKSGIDAILRVTKLSYEEAFKEEPLKEDDGPDE